MFDGEEYNPVLEELREIAESMKEIEKLISQQISIENANNILLRKLLEKKQDSHLEPIDNLDIDKHINENLLIINSSKEKSIEIIKKVCSKLKKKIVVSEAKTDSELAALINGMSDGDIVFVDVSEPLFDNKMARVLSECVEEHCIKIPIGKGNGARIVSLDIPEVSFIIYAYMEEFLPIGLREKLVLVK